MSTSLNAQQLTTLLRISSELDIIGDVTATVATPSELLAWAHALPEPTLCAWRAEDSGNRYVQVTAACHRNPVHGRVTAVLTGDGSSRALINIGGRLASCSKYTRCFLPRLSASQRGQRGQFRMPLIGQRPVNRPGRRNLPPRYSTRSSL
jgi:hypothetical protein